MLGVAAAGLVTVVAPVAHAAGDTMAGKCFFNTDSNRTATGGAEAGVIGDLSVTRDGAGEPTAAVVSCKIQVNGVDAPNTTFSYSGIGVQAGTDQISFDDEDGTLPVALCQRVVYADGTDSGWTCEEPTTINWPPQVWDDPINDLFYDVIDPTICPYLAQHAGNYVVFTIGPDGDVSVLDPFNLGLNPVEDCPPYIVF
jgi:hypothetical protein